MNHLRLQPQHQPQPAYSLSDILGAILVTKRPKCTRATPASKWGRIAEGDRMLEWPVHVDARVMVRTDRQTVTMACPNCKYRWRHYSTTAKRGDRPWAI